MCRKWLSCEGRSLSCAENEGHCLSCADSKRMCRNEGHCLLSAENKGQWLSCSQNDVQKMKDTLTDEYKLRQHSILNEEDAEKEAQELAQLL